MSRRRQHPRAATTRSAQSARSAGQAVRGGQRVDPDLPCPCGLSQPYGECCGRFHRGTESPATAEQLMRSRYSAFALGDADYLVRTWHPSTRPGSLQLESDQRWTKLEILASSGGGLFDQTGTVEFRAHFTELGEADVMVENSRFTRIDGQWYYFAKSTG